MKRKLTLSRKLSFDDQKINKLPRGDENGQTKAKLNTCNVSVETQRPMQMNLPAPPEVFVRFTV